MWANAQRDGRPDEYRWRPLFNAAKLPCSNAAKTRNQLKCAGVPKLVNRSQPLVSRSSPYCGGHVEDILLLNKLFFRLSICALVAKI